MGDNYWDVPSRILYHEIPLLSTIKEYKLSNILDAITQREIIGIRIRQPNANAYTKKGKKLIADSIYYASHIVLVKEDEKNLLESPMSSFGERTGGDNNFLRINKDMRIDFTSGRSMITFAGTDAALAAAVTDGQAYELQIQFADAVCKID